MFETPPPSPSQAPSSFQTSRKAGNDVAPPVNSANPSTTPAAPNDTPPRKKKDSRNLQLKPKPDPKRDLDYDDNCDEMEGLWAKISLQDYHEKYFSGTRKRPEGRKIAFGLAQTTNSRKDGEKGFYEKVHEAKLLSTLYVKDMHNVYGKALGDTLLSPDIVLLDKDLSMKRGNRERIDNVFACMIAFGDLKGSDQEDPCWGLDPGAEDSPHAATDARGDAEGDDGDSEQGHQDDDGSVEDGEAGGEAGYEEDDDGEGEGERGSGEEDEGGSGSEGERVDGNTKGQVARKRAAKSMPSDTDKARRARGQVIQVAKNIFARGCRTACHCFVVMPSFARLVCFDNSGAIFTERFDWKNTDYLADFFWALDQASPSQRGMDTSVTTIEEKSAEFVDAQRILKAQAASLPHGITVDLFYPKHGRRLLFNVYDDAKHEFHRVVTSEPYIPSYSFIGRATCGYLGVDLDEGCTLFMKDAWRINMTGIAKESDTYRRLHLRLETAKVEGKYLPDFYFGGDVPAVCPSLSDKVEWLQQNPTPEMQATASYEYIEKERVTRPRSDKTDKTDTSVEVYPHAHHRQLFKKIGAPLRTFRCTRELCTALYHALLCHDMALDYAQILHRDLSGENILIDKDGNGILTDWELCRYMDDPPHRRRKGRTGTWEFMSVPLVRGDPDYVQGRKDDIESVVHILFYFVLRYTKIPGDDAKAQAANKASLLKSMRETFDDATRRGKGGRLFGGDLKLSYLRNATFTDAELSKRSPPILAAFMKRARFPFTMIYQEVPTPSTDEPEPPFDFDPDDMGTLSALEVPTASRDEIIERIRKYNKALSTSSQIITSLWKVYLAASERWPADDKAHDNFPFDLRQMIAPASGHKRKSEPMAVRSYEPGSGHDRRVVSRTSLDGDASSSSHQVEASIDREDAGDGCGHTGKS